MSNTRQSMKSNFFLAFVALFFLHYGVIAQYSSCKQMLLIYKLMLIADFPALGGNLSAHASFSSVASSPAVTASASLSQSVEQVADCNPCMIVAAWSGISRVYWYSSSLGVTLDTVSLVVTQYNNTAITRTSTAYGDIDSVNMSTVAEAQSIASSLSISAFGGDMEYNGFMGVLLGNATKGNDDASNLPAYPTPYLAIDGFQYFSLSSQVDGCPLVKRGSSQTCSCPMNDIAYRWVLNAQDPFDGDTEVPSVSLTSTYYETLDSEDFTREMDTGFRSLNNESFSGFLSSASVFKSYPELGSCAVFHFIDGPPQIMIPALALTTTVATTTIDSGPYRPSTPQPASPVTSTPIAPQTVRTLPTTQTGQAAPVPVPKPPPAAPTPSSPEVAPSSPNIPASPGSLPAEESTEKAGQQPPSQGLNPVLTFGGSTYTADQSSNIVLSSQTLLPGSPAATVDNTPISIAPGGLAAVVGTSTQLLATLPSPAVLTFGESAYTADAFSNIVLAGSTLRAGGSPVVVSGTTVSLVPGGAAAVVGTYTQVLGGLMPAQGSSNTVQNVPYPVPATPVLTFEGSTYTANAASQFVVAGQTVTPGGMIKISNTPISIAPGASLAVIGSSTQSLVGSAITPRPVLTFAGSTYTAGTSSDFLIDRQTLTKGGVINIDGTELSFGQAGTYVIIGTSTQQLQTPSFTATSESILTFDGSTYTAGSSSEFIIDGQTLTRGGIIDMHGTRLSYGQDGTEIVVGTSTQKLGTASMTVAEEPTITFAGSTYLADSASNFIIDGQTLSRGGTINVDGTRLSYGQDGTDVVIGTSTEGVGLGGYIMSGFSAGPTSTSPVAFTGKAARRTAAAWVLYLICLGLALYVAR